MMGPAFARLEFTMRQILRFLAPLFLFAASSLAAPANSFLPGGFAGWQQEPGTLRHSADPVSADPTNAPVLKEYGFSDFDSVTYTHGGGRKLTIKAARFNDATGAYGAFTFYRSPEMVSESIGDQAVSRGNRVLFFRGNILIDAVFDRVTAMSASELRTLASELPSPEPSLSHIPDLARYLPQPSLIQNSAKYVVGPVAFEKLQPAVPPSVVDFKRSAELAIGNYKTSDGTGTLTLIYYPTPQIAANQMRTIEQLHPAQASQGQFQIRRTGPMLVIASGEISASEAKSLLASVDYEADVTYNEPTFMSKRDNIGNLLVAAFTLIGFILLFALVLGLGFGGFRIMMKKLYPDRVFDREQDVGIISLNLRE